MHSQRGRIILYKVAVLFSNYVDRCSGMNSIPQFVYLESQNITFFGNRAFADVIT